MQNTKSENWGALRTVAIAHFQYLRSEHPEWSLPRVFESLKLPRTRFLTELAEIAGFRDSTEVTDAATCAVAGCILKGVWSPEVIAKETALSVEVVCKILQTSPSGFGFGGYGDSAYGSSRAYSKEGGVVTRKITTAGQLSYKGSIYTLGCVYRGRHALVREEGECLVVAVRHLPTRRFDLAHFSEEK